MFGQQPQQQYGYPQQGYGYQPPPSSSAPSATPGGGTAISRSSVSPPS